eukprot:7270493-Prymnesium_polylepis.1
MATSYEQLCVRVTGLRGSGREQGARTGTRKRRKQYHARSCTLCESGDNIGHRPLCVCHAPTRISPLIDTYLVPEAPRGT